MQSAMRVIISDASNSCFGTEELVADGEGTEELVDGEGTEELVADGEGTEEFASFRARLAAATAASKFLAFRSRSASRSRTRADSGRRLSLLTGSIVPSGTTISATLADSSLLPHLAARSTAATGTRSVAASSFRAAIPRIAVTGPLSTMRLL
jgi:hypothetical protein